MNLKQFARSSLSYLGSHSTLFEQLPDYLSILRNEERMRRDIDEKSSYFEGLVELPCSNVPPLELEGDYIVLPASMETTSYMPDDWSGMAELNSYNVGEGAVYGRGAARVAMRKCLTPVRKSVSVAIDLLSRTGDVRPDPLPVWVHDYDVFMKSRNNGTPSIGRATYTALDLLGPQQTIANRAVIIGRTMADIVIKDSMLGTIAVTRIKYGGLSHLLYSQSFPLDRVALCGGKCYATPLCAYYITHGIVLCDNMVDAGYARKVLTGKSLLPVMIPTKMHREILNLLIPERDIPVYVSMDETVRSTDLGPKLSDECFTAVVTAANDELHRALRGFPLDGGERTEIEINMGARLMKSLFEYRMPDLHNELEVPPHKPYVLQRTPIECEVDEVFPPEITDIIYSFIPKLVCNGKNEYMADSEKFMDDFFAKPKHDARFSQVPFMGSIASLRRR